MNEEIEEKLFEEFVLMEGEYLTQEDIDRIELAQFNEELDKSI